MAKVQVDLVPWCIPTRVVLKMPVQPKEAGFKESPSWPLCDVDLQTLAAMCDDFRAGVFRQAGKADPKL